MRSEEGDPAPPALRTSDMTVAGGEVARLSLEPVSTMRRAVRIGTAGALALALFVLGGIGLFGGDGDRAEPRAPGPAAETLLRPAAAAGSLDGAIAALQDRLQVLPGDWRSWAALGLAYVQQARISADPAYYPKAEGVLRRSLSINGRDNFEALVGMGALSLARHDFEAALRWGERAREVNPFNGSVYGVIGDAQIELGRYQEGFDTFQNMVDTRPDLASYARVSYARELMGDGRGAISAMRTALEFAGTSEDAAWASHQLGELYFNRGQPARAAEQYRRAAELAPGFVPPFAGLAKVAWARGRIDQAITRYTDVVRRSPTAEYAIALGDLYASNANHDRAREQFELVRATQRLYEAAGVNVDLELALFDADHGDPARALATARAEWGRRHSIHVADALGWALFASGDYGAAAPYARRALGLGTENALFLFHAGMIQSQLGNEGAARSLLRRALEANPNFSIQHAPTASRALAGLEASR